MTATCNQAQQTTAQSSITTLLVADRQCPKIRQLLAKSLVPVLWLDGVREPLAAISEELSDRRSQGEPVQALHWVSHGSPGVLRVGEKKVDRAALLAATNQLINWRLDQLAVWACNYGADNSALSLWEELLGATVYSSSGILGLDAEGQKHWTLHSKRHNKTIDWPLNFGDNRSWVHQLATVSYATFSEGPETSDPLTSSEEVTAVGYAPSLYSVDTNYVNTTFDAIANLSYTTYTDDYSFLDSAVETDLIYIAFPQSTPSTSQLDNLKQFVEGGGTLLINGEFSPNWDTVNANVSLILDYVGSSIVVKEGIGSISDSDLNATPPDGTDDIIEIGNYDITSGISTVKTGWFGALEIDDESAEAILVTSENATNNIVMAREAVGSGNTIVFADVNMFHADNNSLFSNIIIQSKINIAVAVNIAPTISNAGDTLAFTEGDGATVIDSSLSISDDDDTNIESATVTISSGFQSAEDVLAFSDTSSITGSWDASGSTGVLTLTGSDTLANYKAALESVTYNNTSDNPDTSDRTISWVVNDGDDSSSSVTSTITVAAVNAAPGISNAGGTLAFTEGDGATVIDSSLSISDDDDTNIESATVTISSGFQSAEDVLAFSDTSSITGSWDASGSTGVLTLTGSDTLANYKAALESVTYNNTSDNPDTSDRTISWVVNDGDDSSSAATSTVTITAVDDPATITGDTSGTAAEDIAAITGTLTATDIEGLTDGTYFSIESGNTPTNGTASIHPESGVWSYTPSANFNGNDQFTVTVTDDLGGTTTQQIDLTITAVDDQAVVTGDTSGSVTEDSDTTTATGTLSITDVDADDSPAFADLAGTSGDNAYGSFSLTSGTWTYTLDNANTTVDALDDGDTLTDTYTFTATDGTTQTITVTINGADDVSVVTGDTSGSVTEDSDTTTATGTLSITDVDADDSPAFADLAATSGDNAYGSFSLTSGTWTYTLDNANTTVNALDDGDTLTDTYTFTATDGTTQTITVTINGETDPTPSPSPSPSPQPTPEPTPEPEPSPQPTPAPTPEPSPEPTPAPDPTPADTAPLATDVQLSDDDGDGLKEVITAADGELIDGNGDGIADAEQSDVVGLRMINDGADNTDYGALETDPALSFSAISFLNPTEPATDTSGTGSNQETYAVTTSDGQTQTTTIPNGIDNAFAGLLAFTVSGLSNGGSTSTTISLPQGLNNLETAQLAYLRFNYTTNRFEDFVDASGTPLYSFQDSNGDGLIDSVVLQLIDGDPAWDGDGIANGSIIDPGFLATGDRNITGNRKANTLEGNVLANTLRGKNGNDTLLGHLGNDTLIGNRKRDRLIGGEGDDLLKGKSGSDVLKGGAHDDRLNGGKGDDTLIGGSGADRFRISQGKDTIKDFSIADGDLIDANGYDLQLTQRGDNLLLSDSEQGIKTKLLNVDQDGLLQHQPELFG